MISQKITAVILSVFFYTQFIFAQSTSPWEGSGTEEDPFKIATSGHLKTLADNVNAGEKYANTYFRITADIDLIGYNTDEGWTPIGYKKKFHGNVNGGGYIISNLFINNPDANGMGLFGITENSQFDSINIVSANITGKNSVAILAAMPKKITVKACHASGIITAEKTAGALIGGGQQNKVYNSNANVEITGQGNNIGGLVGLGWKGEIADSYSEQKVTTSGKFVGGIIGNANEVKISRTYSIGDVKGLGTIGGISGMNEGVSVTECYFIGTVTGGDAEEGTNYVGGLIGFQQASTVSECYTVATVSGRKAVGGLIGVNANGKVSECFAAGHVIGDSCVGGVIGEFSNYRASIKNCIALNDSVKGSNNNDVNRFVGKLTMSATLNDLNYANSDMLVNNETVIDNNLNAIGKPLADFKKYSTYTDFWNFEKNWSIWEDQSLPYFKWQSAPAIITSVNNNIVSFNLLNPATAIEVTINDTIRQLLENEYVAGENTISVASTIGDVIAIRVYETDKWPSLANKMSNTSPSTASDITLNKSEVNIILGSTFQLIALPTPEDLTDLNLVWTSSADSVVSIDQDGLVTAKAIGEGIITVFLAEDEEINADCKIIVYDSIVTITLNETDLNMIIGKEFAFEATIDHPIYADSTLVWESSDNSIVTITENGIAKGMGIGDAIITAFIAGNQNIKSSCNIKITDSISQIILNESDLKLTIGQEFLFIAEITPSDIVNADIQWSATPESIITINQDGLVKATGLGEGTVSVSSTDNPNITAKCIITVCDPLSSVTLNQEDITIKVGSQFHLQITTTPAIVADSFIWTSSENAIASITQDGVVSGMASGTSVVTVKSNSNPNITAKCNVHVIDTVSAITLNVEEIALKIGAEFLLTASITPENLENITLLWSSSDSSIATVDNNGNIIAKKQGDATITVCYKENNNISASCKVTVLPTITSITFDHTELELIVDKQYNFHASVNPPSLANTIIWKSSNENVATVNQQGVVKTLAIGQSTITATAPEDASIFASCVITVITNPINIEEQSDNHQFAVYPNPTTGELFFNLNGEQQIKHPIEIYNYNGMLVFVSHEISCDISSLPNGIYFVKYGQSRIKIIKQ